MFEQVIDAGAKSKILHVPFSLIILNLFLFSKLVFCEETVRIATYNIRVLDKDISETRLNYLKKVIENLAADVIGLQEIDDRKALELVFPKNEWHIIIDDDSDNSQDLALVVRKHLKVLGFESAKLNADDRHFLFPEASDWKYFPKRRDVLFVEIKLKEYPDRFFVMVLHSKSRWGGRHSTDERRAGAAQALVKKLEQEFDE